LKKSPRAGFWKCYQRIRRTGHLFNHKRVYRVYCRMGLNLRRRTKRVLPKRIARPLVVSLFPNQQWALDFMHDTLYCGKRFEVTKTSSWVIASNRPVITPLRSDFVSHTLR